MRRRLLIRTLLIPVGVGGGGPGGGGPGIPSRSLKPARMEIAVRASPHFLSIHYTLSSPRSLLPLMLLLDHAPVHPHPPSRHPSSPCPPHSPSVFILPMLPLPSFPRMSIRALMRFLYSAGARHALLLLLTRGALVPRSRYAEERLLHIGLRRSSLILHSWVANPLLRGAAPPHRNT